MAKRVIVAGMLRKTRKKKKGHKQNWPSPLGRSRHSRGFCSLRRTAPCPPERPLDLPAGASLREGNYVPWKKNWYEYRDKTDPIQRTYRIIEVGSILTRKSAGKTPRHVPSYQPKIPLCQNQQRGNKNHPKTLWEKTNKREPMRENENKKYHAHVVKIKLQNLRSNKKANSSTKSK